MNKLLKYSLIILIIFSFPGCKMDEKKVIEKSKITAELIDSDTLGDCPPFILKKKDENLNISILLDLSDRIKTEGQKEKDLAYISIIANTFLKHLSKKPSIMLEDKLELFFHPTWPGKDISDISEKLKIHFTSGVTSNLLSKTTKHYNDLPVKLYDFAGGTENFPGSDIWGFFKYNIKNYCIDDCHRNILVVLTDGFMYFDKSVSQIGNKTSYLTPKTIAGLGLSKGDYKKKMSAGDYGFIANRNDLHDLEVLVIGIPDYSPERDIVEMYWSKWFTEMGVKKFKITNADIPANVEKVINDFILN